jgi:HAD superfamily hydrolase (TIGR01662 family)
LSDDPFSTSDAPSLPGGIKAVFFDAGNTITYLDSEWIARRLMQDGWDIDEAGLFYGQCVAAYEASRLALLKKYPTDSDRHIPYFSRVLELAGIPADFVADCAAVLRDEHKRSILWRAVTPDVRRTVESLQKRGYVLGVISNTDGRLKALIDSVGLTDYFRCIVDSAVEGVEKPDPEIFLRAVRAAELEPAQCVYVGDIYAVDIEGARRAGLTGILIDPLCLHEEFHCMKIAKLSDLLNLLPPLGDASQHAVI